MGHESFKNALHKYFDKYQWKNTQLTDFLGTLVEAYGEKDQKDQVMGSKWDFKWWCETWLKGKGINILEPIITYNNNGSIQSFQIKQSNETTPSNFYRKQLIDIAVYDE